MIANPIKKTIVNFPIQKIKTAIDDFIENEPKIKLIKSNKAFNQYVFDEGEFLSNGAYVNLDLNEISESKTEITIEVSRKVGAFDQRHEISLANSHIEKYMEMLGNYTDESHLEIKRKEKELRDYERNKPWHDKFGWMFFWTIIFFPVAIYGLVKSKLKTFDKVFLAAIIAIELYVIFK